MTAAPAVRGPVVARVIARVMLALCGALLFALGATPAHAQRCDASATTMAFGDISTGSNARYTATATITVSCTGGSRDQEMEICPYIGGGASPGANGPRYMVAGGNRLAFDVYQDSSLSNRYANGVQVGANRGYSFQLSQAGSGTLQIAVYGEIPAGQQGVAPGSFTGDLSTGAQIAYRAGYAGSGGTWVDCGNVGTRNVDAFTFTATARNLAACTLATSAVQFGTVQIINSARDATGTISVNCSAGATFSIGISGGANGGTNGTNRRMLNGASSITYGLYRDTNRTAPWYTDSGNVQTATATGASQTFTVYGRVPAQATPPVGTYADTVVVTITY